MNQDYAGVSSLCWRVIVITQYVADHRPEWVVNAKY
jgi:hypothetical protein